MALSTLAPTAASEDADPMPWRQQCPGAAAWMGANERWQVPAMKQRDQARVLTQPRILAELAVRVEADQAARQRARRSSFAPQDVQAAAEVDADNQRWLAKVIRESGFPTANQVGEHGLHLTWLLVHHADQQPRFQRHALIEFQRLYEAGDFGAAELARLTDRVLKKQGSLQAFGTQVDWAAGVESGIRQIVNLVEIERNRRSLGLMPLADYGCMMHALRSQPDR